MNHISAWVTSQCAQGAKYDAIHQLRGSPLEEPRNTSSSELSRPRTDGPSQEHMRGPGSSTEAALARRAPATPRRYSGHFDGGPDWRATGSRLSAGRRRQAGRPGAGAIRRRRYPSWPDGGLNDGGASTQRAGARGRVGPGLGREPVLSLAKRTAT